MDDLEFIKGDSKEDIDKCLSCELPECTNCIQYRRAKKHVAPVGGFSEMNIDKLTPAQARVFDLWVQGYLDTEIAEIIGRDVTSVFAARKGAHVPPLPKGNREERMLFVQEWMSK